MKSPALILAVAIASLSATHANNKSYSRILNPKITGKSTKVHKGHVGKPKVEKKEDGTVIIRKRKAGTRHRISTGPTSRRSIARLTRGKGRKKK